jgi:alkylation response protein AidB-like acyl-CoA dehydrogenase
MNFDFSDDQRLLQQTARDFLSERAPLTVCRSVLEDESSSFDAKLWNSAAEMGWTGTVIPDEYGGAGFGYLELALLAEELGRALAPIPFGSSVYLASEAVNLLGSEEQRERLLPGFAKGERIGCFAVTEGLGRPSPDTIAAKLDGDRLTGSKHGVPDAAAANCAIVLAREGDGFALAFVDLAADGVRRENLRTIDPSRPAGSLHFDGAAAERIGASGEGWALCERLLHRAAVLQAFEQVGGAQAALDATREFTLGRYAFGRPIASFQALKHRMADVYAAIELARANSYFGVWALQEDDAELGEAACSARIGAIDAFELATIEMIQMHGGVGYTWEYDCHLYYRRAKLLAASIGTAADWKERLMTHLLAGKAA